MEQEEIEKTIKAGKLVQEVIAYSKEIIKPGLLLLDIAHKIDEKISELGANPAFPVNLSVNEQPAPKKRK